ncbi:hypothetical protein ACQP25_44400 (plasmid) [Microtetraspora malaysiensis]|uniref:hypothetical protein n=1 Tax=Microtetraspora malaysiensis TaxID=161358 RepID=UPI003D90BFCF
MSMSDQAAGEQPAAAGMDRYGANRAWMWAAVLEELAKAVRKVAAARLASTRPDGSPVMAVGDRETAFAGGRRLGSATMYDGKATATLAGDDPRLVAWAKERPHYEGAVIRVEMVTPAVVDELKKHAVKVRAPVDRHGEVIPGMTVKTGDPYLVRDLDRALVAEMLSPENVARIVEAVIAGMAAIPGVAELESAG